MNTKKTLVIGASENTARYSNMAIHRLLSHNQPVVAIGHKKGNVEGVEIVTEYPAINDIDTVTLYLNPTNQIPYYDYILSLKPKRIIFNPGTENAELEAIAEDAGIKVMEACTLVLLGTGQY
ncbi:MAG: CoA-binding protein [Bacteroidota bacterium]